MGMNIYAQPGTKVVFTGRGGSGYDQEEAAKYLQIGKTYTVKKTDVGGWRTTVYLQEVSQRGFNSVMFENADDT